MEYFPRKNKNEFTVKTLNSQSVKCIRRYETKRGIFENNNSRNRPNIETAKESKSSEVFAVIMRVCNYPAISMIGIEFNKKQL